MKIDLVDVSDIFIFFLLLGGGEGGVQGAGRGWGDFYGKSQEGGGLPGGWGRGVRAGMVFVGILAGGGGGAKYFFVGAEMSTE